MRFYQLQCLRTEEKKRVQDKLKQIGSDVLKVQINNGRTAEIDNNALHFCVVLGSEVVKKNKIGG